MAYPLFISPRAERQLEKAIQWYESQQDGLGRQLRGEFEDTLRQIVENPYAYHPRTKLVRSARLKKFDAYAIYFRVINETVRVYLFFHASRNPKSLNKNFPPE